MARSPVRSVLAPSSLQITLDVLFSSLRPTACAHHTFRWTDPPFFGTKPIVSTNTKHPPSTHVSTHHPDSLSSGFRFATCLPLSVDALVTSSVLVTTSKALVTRSDALVTSSKQWPPTRTVSYTFSIFLTQIARFSSFLPLPVSPRLPKCSTEDSKKRKAKWDAALGVWLFMLLMFSVLSLVYKDITFHLRQPYLSQ